LRLGTRHKKDSLDTGWMNKAGSTGCATQSEVKVKQKIQIRVPRDESHVSVGGLLALGYGRKRILQKKRRNTNYAEGRLTDIRSKWLKKQKRWSEVRERKSLDEEIEEERLVRKVDRGQLNKWKNPSVYALENLVGRKERHGGEALKTRVNLT
jgi:hypothetical protein